MMHKLPRHDDLDSTILKPAEIVWKPFFVLLGLTIGGSLIIAALGTIALVLVTDWQITLKIFFAVLLATVVVELIILTWKTRHAMQKFIDMVLATFEAWLERSGFSIDLNRDGKIGYIISNPALPQLPEPKRSIPTTANGETRMLLAHDAETIAPPEIEAEAVDTEIERVVIKLIDGTPIPQDTIEHFINHGLEVGLARKHWVDTGLLEREIHDSLLNHFRHAGVVTQRKPGHPAKFKLENPRHIRYALGLLG